MAHATMPQAGSSTMRIPKTLGVSFAEPRGADQEEGIHPEISLIRGDEAVSFCLKLSQDKALNFRIPKLTLSFDSTAIASSLDDVPDLGDFVHSRVMGRRSTLTNRTVAK